MPALRAPFPYFGGKSRAAELIWERFGDVANYVEPFYGSGAVLLKRPTEPRIETVNDLDANVANFWRAVQRAPEAVAHWADGPVNEADLHARHRWLVAELPAHRERMLQRPEYFNAKIAGWWCWGLSQWIGSGWCDSSRLERDKGTRPDVHGDREGMGVHRKRPVMGGDNPGRGVHRVGLKQQRPALDGIGGVHGQIPRCNGLGGQGLHGAKVPHKMPLIAVGGPAVARGDGGNRAGYGIHGTTAQTDGIAAWFLSLQARLRRVRVCCGDWTRIMGPSVILGNGITGILLDPPYRDDERTKGLYAEDSGTVAAEVRRWALEHGDDPRLRIALCGYDGEHTEHMPSSWECVPWKANGGYSNVRDGQNKHRERIWFSPHCLREHRGQQALALGAAS